MVGATTDSILDKTKKLLGIEADYPAFDVDIIMHINTVFSTLSELGIGPVDGFLIEDNTTQWSAFIVDKPYLNQVRSYMYLRVRLLFDPPTTSFAIEAIKNQITEFEWRLSLYAPKADYTTTTP